VSGCCGATEGFRFGVCDVNLHARASADSRTENGIGREHEVFRFSREYLRLTAFCHKRAVTLDCCMNGRAMCP